MKNRIGIWASAGFLVALGWASYTYASQPMTYADPVIVLVQLTCPIAVIGSQPVRLEWVLLANAATYALVGLLVENLRQRIRFKVILNCCRSIRAHTQIVSQWLLRCCIPPGRFRGNPTATGSRTRVSTRAGIRA